MRSLLTVLLFCVSLSAMAETWVLSFDGSSGPAKLTLKEEPCDNGDVLMHLAAVLKGDLIAQFKNSVLNWEGKDWASCWVEIDGAVFSVDSEGVRLNAPYGGIPKSEFQPEGI